MFKHSQIVFLAYLSCLQAFDLETVWNVPRESVEYEYNHNIAGLNVARPLIIAHRGFSGYYPEHTVAAYQAAVDAGADVIECDVGVSKDGVLLCLHESWMGATTDAASKFNASRINTYEYEGRNITDYFSVDFTFEELQTLRKVQQLPFRSQKFNGLYGISTLKEFLQVAFTSNKTVGVHVEIKDPYFYNEYVNLNTSFEEMVVSELLGNGCSDRADAPCFVQCFDLESLRMVRNMTNLPLFYLTEHEHELDDDGFLDGLAQWVYGVGPYKGLIVNEDGETDLIRRCHARGLKVHSYTFRNENSYLLDRYMNDAYFELAELFSLNLDGFFTDFPCSLHSFFTSVYSVHQQNQKNNYISAYLISLNEARFPSHRRRKHHRSSKHKREHS